MFIQKYRKQSKDKVYETIYLSQSYRENGKVKHEHLANLTKMPENLLKALERELKGQNSISLENLLPEQGKSYGGLFAVSSLSKRTGISQALGSNQQSKLALFQIAGRILCRKSRNYLATQWSEEQAIEEVFGLGKVNANMLYANLEWLSENQEKIENKLFKIRNKNRTIRNIYLYDITSSYLEGEQNEYAEYGYNRDKKRGKKQIVIGLLCDDEGYPVCVEVFKGNTSDCTTVSSQLKKLKERFGAKDVIFVGDRGMVKSKSIEEITDENWQYVTAITKEQIQTLINQKTVQLELFTEELTEIELTAQTKVRVDGRDETKEIYTRYILRRNPVRMNEIRTNRNSRIEKVKEFVETKNLYLQEHPKAQYDCALKAVKEKIGKLNVSQFISVESNESERRLSLNVDETKLEQTTQLDGCYVIKSNVKKSVADKQTVHDRYKDLADVEWAFRTMKQSFEDIRPIYVRKKARTRGHVFVCMLAYIVIKTAWTLCKNSGIEQTAVFESLDRIQYSQYDVKGVKVKALPVKLNPRPQEILNLLNLKLPNYV